MFWCGTQLSLMMWSFAAIFDFHTTACPSSLRTSARPQTWEWSCAASGSPAILKTHFTSPAPPLPFFSLRLSLSGLTRGRVEVNSLGVSNYSSSILGGGGGTGPCGCRKRTLMSSHCCFLAEVVRLSGTFEHRPVEAIRHSRIWAEFLIWLTN